MPKHRPDPLKRALKADVKAWSIALVVIGLYLAVNGALPH